MINETIKERPSNAQIIRQYIHTYRHSPQSQATRRSCLNYFFEKKYFGFSGHIFEITKAILMDFRDYLNHNEELSLKTKKLKWSILRSFIEYVEDYYETEYKLHFKIPKKTKWQTIHKLPESNTDTFLTLDEIQKILLYLKHSNFKYYIIFRLFAESGPRKGGIIALDFDKIHLNERYFETKEKTGRVVYYFSEEMRKYLSVFFNERKLIESDTKAFFLSTHLKRFSRRPFNQFLKLVMVKLGIEKNITCQVFRRSLNALRFEMGCRDPILSILLSQAVPGVNFNNYVRKSLDYEIFLEYFDKWTPYREIEI